MKYKAFLLNSLDTVFWDSDIKESSLSHTTILKNEAFSVQLAFSAEKESEDDPDNIELGVRITSGLNNELSIYEVKNVALMRVALSTSDDWYLRKTPGLYPDRMRRLKKGAFTAVAGQWRALWITFNEKLDNLPAGVHPIKIQIYERKTKNVVSESEFALEVIAAELPHQEMYVTNWIHYDCISAFSNTRPFSNEFFDVLKRYVALAVKNGQNTILTPAFTPPLDTEPGKERMTVQLVKIEKQNGLYSFDFSDMHRFIDICLECGIEYFEHSHLYTQWGAKHAPKIIVKENGKNKKMFGWKTDASSKEYKDFLHSYLTALKCFIKENGYEKKFFFHVSDEPSEEMIDDYSDASMFVQSELKDYPIGDALSDYKYFESGLVKVPISLTYKVESFYKKASPLWMYYTGMQSNYYLSNRMIGMPQERERVLGVQLYYYDIQGFLHWGFNAHHNNLAREIVDPGISPDMNGDFAGGSSFLVYPNGKDVDSSIRLNTFRDLMQDVRAMRLLESMIGRDEVCSMIKQVIPDISIMCRVTSEQILELRNRVNAEISQNLD
ncbi:MAG: DUF4091 domain-containing protein [Monoglobaceae bacterium]